MAINKNHEFEELNGIKCGIVEKNVSGERAGFLKQLLEFNGYEVIVVPSAPPKAAASAGTEAETPPDVPQTFTVGVTDYTFNPVNAIFGRLLSTPERAVVTQAYWNQQAGGKDEVPYYERK